MRGEAERRKSVPMTRPRYELIDRDEGGFYHIFNRCVRHASLCGDDPVTGENRDHRRGWIESRLLALTDVFAVNVYAYAVMSNHYHIVVHYCPQQAHAWTDAEVVRRWLSVYGSTNTDCEQSGQEWPYDAEWIQERRERLGDLSWYMRALNEYIARKSNREDHCTGHFWEGRYRSKTLPNERAVHACMVYNDLNPFRAGMVDHVDAKQHTSLRRRLEEAAREPQRQNQPLRPLRLDPSKRRIATAGQSLLTTTLSDYLKQVEWTAVNFRSETRASTDPPLSLCRAKPWLKSVAQQRQRTRSHTPLARSPMAV